MSAICIGTTTSGEPCRKKAKLGNDYCPQHDPERKPRESSASRQHFGNVRRLPSHRWQASYWHEGARHIAEQTFASKGDALAHLATIETDLRRGAWIDPHRAAMTVGSLAAQWKVANPAKRSSSLA